MLIGLLFLNFLLMIVMPVFLGRWIARRRRVGWGLFGIGAVAFVLSQVGHIPFNILILNKLGWVDLSNLIVFAAFAGLSAGTFEGIARYAALRFWAKDARTWGKGLMVGAGHGGIESILVGVFGLINFVLLLGRREGHFAGFFAAYPADYLILVDAQIESTFSLPAWMALLGAVERLFAILLHLAATLLVMQVFIRKQLRWLAAGILWHAAIDGVLVYVVTRWGGVTAELVLGGMSLISLGIIFGLRQPEPEEPELESLPVLKPLAPLEVAADSLDRSKYTS